MATRISIKPLSVNSAYTGKRYATPEYKAFKKSMAWLLPRNLEIPEGNLEIRYTWGVSNSGADVDNPCKPTTDVIASMYGFNDKRVYRVVQEKIIVPKGKEYIEFEIVQYKPLETAKAPIGASTAFNP